MSLSSIACLRWEKQFVREVVLIQFPKIITRNTLHLVRLPTCIESRTLNMRTFCQLTRLRHTNKALRRDFPAERRRPSQVTSAIAVQHSKKHQLSPSLWWWPRKCPSSRTLRVPCFIPYDGFRIVRAANAGSHHPKGRYMWQNISEVPPTTFRVFRHAYSRRPFLITSFNSTVFRVPYTINSF